MFTTIYNLIIYNRNIIDDINFQIPMATKPRRVLFIFRFLQTWQYSLMHKERF